MPIWKEVPFLRLLIPLISGILVQWYFKWSFFVGCYVGIIALVLLISFSYKNIATQFKSYWLNGIFINCLVFSVALMISNVKLNSGPEASMKSLHKNSRVILATLKEPLSPKAKTFKALSSIQIIDRRDSLIKITGYIIIYFQKEDSIPNLHYGSQLIFTKQLQVIKNSGNPGSFDYRRYCEFQNIYFQVFLKSGEYKILSTTNQNFFKKFIFATRIKIVTILRKYIPNSKEFGLAEALLIGYKDDLDKNLIRAYSNTGVVHVIAISGLHVGLIYWLLNLFLEYVAKSSRFKHWKPIVITAGLWIFSLTAGGSASVLRSAVMFTFIALGENISRKISVYNSLAASAFILLCYNPFWLWDVGFQLSYTAVLSIVVFMKPVYNLFFIETKILDSFWKLNAVTLSAQILTVPICFYYFHQFPNFFFLANLLAVPLSSIILIGELILCCTFFIPMIPQFVGTILYWLIYAMNTFIEAIDKLPFSVSENIQISLLQVICLYVIVICIAIWLFRKSNMAFIYTLFSIFIFGIIRFYIGWEVSHQRKVIVYNIPNYQAIDLVDGRNCLFTGDSSLVSNNFLNDFHLKPSRNFLRVSRIDSAETLLRYDMYLQFLNRRLVVIDKSIQVEAPPSRIVVDLIILSKNAGVSIDEICRIFSCGQVIFDASNSLGKIQKWKAECEQLGVEYYSIHDRGAFVMNLN
jgi:competence protein ComEC